MKKTILTTLMAVTVLGFAGINSAPIVVNAATQHVVKQYKYDHNTIYGSNGNHYGFVYKNIPASSRYSGSQEYNVGGGWNFITYQHMNYFTGGY